MLGGCWHARLGSTRTRNLSSTCEATVQSVVPRESRPSTGGTDCQRPRDARHSGPRRRCDAGSSRRALMLAGEVLEMAPRNGRPRPCAGSAHAGQRSGAGRALDKFIAICNAQSGMREPPRAPFHQEVPADGDGHIGAIENRRRCRRCSAHRHVCDASEAADPQGAVGCCG